MQAILQFDFKLEIDIPIVCKNYLITKRNPVIKQ